MADSKGVSTAKTLGLVIVVAVAVAVLTTLVQQMIWGRSNGAVSGGAAAGVAVAYAMTRKKKLQAQQPPT